MTKASLGRAVCVAMLVTLFGYLSYRAGEVAIADLYLRSFVQDPARPAVRVQGTPAEVWLIARQHLLASLRYSPLNPRALELAGRHDLAGIRVRADDRSFQATTHSAYEYFRLALQVRPASADAWVALAQTKLFRGEWDEEMFAALRHADQLAPWEYHIQHAIVFVSATAWGKLDADRRAATLRTLERATRHNAEPIAQLLKRVNRLNILCESAIDAPKVRELCSQSRHSTAPRKPQAR